MKIMINHDNGILLSYAKIVSTTCFLQLDLLLECLLVIWLTQQNFLFVEVAFCNLHTLFLEGLALPILGL